MKLSKSIILPFLDWVDYRLPVFSYARENLIDYPTPKNLNYWWNFGSLAGIVLMIMIITGFFLAINYTPHTDYAFSSVEHLMRDVNYGWLLRFMHANGGSMFFILVYIHMFRGLYFGSFKAPRELLWIIGVVIYLCMMGTAFMGYVLPWGQMSYWGATVITSLFSAVPIIGDTIVTWLWGGFVIDNNTLTRFFVGHYLMPMVIFMLVVVHMWALHVHKSNNPLGVDMRTPADSIPFHPYYTIKDMVGMGVFFIVYFGFVFFAPDFFGEPDNYIEANPLVTPPHIVPEWYFLPFYAILRSIDNKLIGVIAMFAGVCILFALPWMDRCRVRSAKFRPIYRQFFWLFFADCILLGYIGAQTAVEPFVTIGRIATAYYFAHFLIICPLICKFERPLVPPESISAGVLKAQKGAE
ncbi:MAG: cytochrome b/b6 [Rhodospirillaceae bacterium]|jgi:ubiquinol-cytochrome c reductase cytochrome b/c1 subunit|nr:cytochrome b/b6 [Rhodospirillaceae bacterium]MBT5243528.1 cytochrome b/b6 [Rhodospirillaceae bacterium]MBT5562116.1 cytochrome b/b6 [Rhodospirillaceae bacterium]MBT6242289.1 cytochrome b/b6 [Rhodospirillaceae bacterium]MBT7137699.1 cytochrome b/b6 [Rhodospirillaceae bacterium]